MEVQHVHASVINSDCKELTSTVALFQPGLALTHLQFFEPELSYVDDRGRLLGFEILWEGLWMTIDICQARPTTHKGQEVKKCGTAWLNLSTTCASSCCQPFCPWKAQGICFIFFRISMFLIFEFSIVCQTMPNPSKPMSNRARWTWKSFRSEDIEIYWKRHVPAL